MNFNRRKLMGVCYDKTEAEGKILFQKTKVNFLLNQIKQ